MTDELKPCPGGHPDPKLVIVDGWSKRSCRECGWNTYLHSTPQQADAEWNTRPEEERLRARIAELEEYNSILLRVMTHIDGSIVMAAKEEAGYGAHIHTLQIPAPLPPSPEGQR